MSDPHPIDTYRDAFLRMVGEGKSHAEALDEFDAKAWNAAMMAEIEQGTKTLLDLSAMALREMADLENMGQAIELWTAGWTSELPEGYRHNSKDFWRQCPVMSWYWRRPPKRAGKPGRKFLSTNQAYRALQRDRGGR